MGAAGDTVGWFRGRLLLNLVVVAVVLQAGRLMVDPISGMPASALGEGQWPRCLQVLFGVK